MVLNDYRYVVRPVLTPISKAFSRFFAPNTISLISVIFAGLGGYSFYKGENLLLLASLFFFLNGFFDALDGKVARLKNKITVRGDFLDEIADRISDMLMLGGIAFSAYCNPLFGVIAIVLAFLVSYTGVQAKASGIERDMGGLLGRADRVAILIFLPLIQYYLLLKGYEKIGGFWFTELAVFVLIFGSLITFFQRFVRAWRKLS